MTSITGSALVAYVRACAITYKGYYFWTGGNADMRSFQLKVLRKDWELSGAIYRVLRRKTLGL